MNQLSGNQSVATHVYKIFRFYAHRENIIARWLKISIDKKMHQGKV